MNRLAIITGASRGIGKEAAYYFAEKGFNVALIARNKTLLEEISNNLSDKFAVTANIYSLDVSNLEQVENTIKEITNHHKSIDILFNSAGVLSFGTSNINPKDFSAMVNANLYGIYNFVYCVAPYMKHQRSGYIFNLSSYAGKRPLPRSGAYCLTKYGVLGYSQSLSLELAEFGIKVTAICPSVIDTEMTEDFSEFPNEEKILRQDITQTLEYLLKLSPNAYVDEVTIKSTFLLKQQ